MAEGNVFSAENREAVSRAFNYSLDEEHVDDMLFRFALVGITDWTRPNGPKVWTEELERDRIIDAAR